MARWVRTSRVLFLTLLTSYVLSVFAARELANNSEASGRSALRAMSTGQFPLQPFVQVVEFGRNLALPGRPDPCPSGLDFGRLGAPGRREQQPLLRVALQRVAIQERRIEMRRRGVLSRVAVRARQDEADLLPERHEVSRRLAFPGILPSPLVGDNATAVPLGQIAR